jgi:hypothetical protein
MVEININGKPNGRRFQNMRQALAFAANNGECINAETLELSYVKANTRKRKKEVPVEDGKEAQSAGNSEA